MILIFFIQNIKHYKVGVLNVQGVIINNNCENCINISWSGGHYEPIRK